VDIVTIKPENCQAIKAPWVSNKSMVQNCMVRIPPSQRWRRVYLFVGLDGHTVENRNHFYYIKSNDEVWTEVVLPQTFSF